MASVDYSLIVEGIAVLAVMGAILSPFGNWVFRRYEDSKKLWILILGVITVGVAIVFLLFLAFLLLPDLADIFLGARI